MQTFAILLMLAIAAAATFVIERNRRLRNRSRKGSRYFSVSLAVPDTPKRPDDAPR